MFKTKIRTILITLIAALSVVSVGPMTSVASARKKESPRSKAALCKIAKEAWREDMKASTEAEKQGDETEAEIWATEARLAREDYEAKGCSGDIANEGPARQKELTPTPPPIKEEATAPTPPATQEHVTTPPPNA